LEARGLFWRQGEFFGMKRTFLEVRGVFWNRVDFFDQPVKTPAWPF
jgi:hypothetical protein